MIRTAFILALFLSVGGAPALAQHSPQNPQTSSREYRGGGAGFFAIGTNVAQLSALNDRLDAAGYPAVGTRLLSLGGGGHRVVGGRFLIGGEGHGLITPSETFQDRNVSLSGGYGLATVGYLAVAHSKWRVYPQLGAGLGGFSLKIGSSDDDLFDDVLDDPNRESELNRGQFLVSLSLQGSYELSGPNEAGGFRIGLQAGYLLAPAAGDWTLGGNTLEDGPDAGFDGPFIRLLIGGGSIR
mgnify:CR=1 FL=1